MSGRRRPAKKRVRSGAANISLVLEDGTEIFIEIRATALAVSD